MRHRPLLSACAALGTVALLLTGCAAPSGADPAASLDPDEPVTLDFAFWGNDVRAEMYDEVLAAFEDEHPNITVRTTFLDYTAFWEKRQTEAAGGGLPDVFQFGTSFMRQYDQNGLLLDLTPYLGDVIDTEPLAEPVLATGRIDERTVAVTISTNFWSMWSNPTLIERVGADPWDGGTWDEYATWISDFTDRAEAAGVEAWGGTDYAGRIQSFELQRRAAGEDLFTADGEPEFTEDDLAEFWNSTASLRESGAVAPQQRIEEALPKAAFDSALTATDVSWDSLGAGFLLNLGPDYPTLDLQAPPTGTPGAADMYPNAGIQLAASARTEHPAAAATLIDFLVNSPATGEVFGLNRGMPASETALSGAELSGLDAEIVEYEQSLGDRVGDPPPTPIVGYGTLEEKFRQLGVELNFGTITVDEAVAQFFSEMDVVISG